MKIGKSPCRRSWSEKSQVSYLISSSSLFSKNSSFVLLSASSWVLVRVLIILDCEVELRDFFRWWMIEKRWRFGKVMNIERFWVFWWLMNESVIKLMSSVEWKSGMWLRSFEVKDDSEFFEKWLRVVEFERLWWMIQGW